MEYNVTNNGEFVPAWQTRFMPDPVPASRQNMQVIPVLVPSPYQGNPEVPYQRQVPFQSFQDVPYQNLQTSPRRFPAQILPTAPRQNIQITTQQGQMQHPQLQQPQMQQQIQPPQMQQPQMQQQIQPPQMQQPQMQQPQMQQPQNVQSQLAQTFQDFSQPPFQDQGSFTFDDILNGSNKTSRPAENSDIEMRHGTPPSVCRSCGGNTLWKSLLDDLASSQKKSMKAWSRFASDVSSEIEENKKWRTSIEEKINRLLEAQPGEGAGALEDSIAQYLSN